MEKDVELSDKWICGKCKNENNIYLIKCKKCGKDFDQNEVNGKEGLENNDIPDISEMHEGNSNASRFIMAIVALSIILIIIKLIFGFPPQNRNELRSETVQEQKENSSEIEFYQNFTRIIELKNPRMEGQDILELQNRLLSLGFNEVGSVDGYYGPLTAGVIKKIQSFFASDDYGKVDERLWNYIFSERNTSFLKRISSVADPFKKISIEDFNPIVCNYILLGGSNGSIWIDSDSINLQADKEYRLYSTDWYIGTGISKKISEDNPVIIIDSDPTVVGNYVAVSSDWDCLPRKPVEQLLNNAEYNEIVKNILVGYGLNNPIANIIQNYRIDLDGDGLDEVIIHACQDTMYSLIFVRKKFNDEEKNIVFEMIPDTLTYGREERLRIIGFFDLNGDGDLEIITSYINPGTHGYKVWKLFEDDAKCVLHNATYWE